MTLKHYLLIGLLLILAHAAILYFMGQVLICKCGYVKFWHGITFSSENSQHLTDWYTFSHIIHGFVFYWITWLLGRKRGWSIGLMLVLSLVAEIGWEIFENTDLIINRYREVTISLDYYGDSVINSVFDVIFMAVGFGMAAYFPVWATIALIVSLEIFVGYFIRDNLTLNIIMLIYPMDWILKWQNSG